MKTFANTCAQFAKFSCAVLHNTRHVNDMLLAKEISPFEPATFWQSPIFASVAAGFPSPADDYLEKTLDLQELLVQHPIATFFVRAKGQSMLGANIHDGDVLVVDRSLEPHHGKIAIVVIDAEFMVKRLAKRGGKLFLVPENDNFPEVQVTEEMDFEVWGIVTNVIHPL
jgi:DNA polymerase V